MVFYVLDRNEVLQTVISNDSPDKAMLFKAVLKEQLNKLYTLDMEVSANQPEAQYLVEENYILFKDLLGEWQLYIIKEVTETHDSEHTKAIYAEHASQELLDEICSYEISGQSLVASTMLSNVLTGTRWSAGNVTSTSARVIDNVKTLNKSVLEAVQALRTEYSFDIKFRFNVVGNRIANRYVDLLQNIGNDYGKRFEYNKDIDKVERVVNTADLKTAIVPVGKDGLDISSVTWTIPTNSLNKPAGQKYLENTTATAKWGYGVAGSKRPRYVYYENTEMTTADDLIRDAYIVLCNLTIPKTTYNLNVVDLFALTGDSSLSYESVKLGDYVVVVDNEFTPALAVKTMVIERDVDLLQPANTEIKLGNYIENLSDNGMDSIMSQVDQKIAGININPNIDEFGNGSYTDIQTLNDQTFHEAVGYTYMKDTEGLWVYDSPIDQTPSKVVAIKGGKLGIGTWNAQLQRWDISTFIDGGSVNASLINSGTLSSDLVKVGFNGITSKVVMDSSGLTVNNGGLKVTNTAGTSVLSADGNGNLTMLGTFTTGQAGNRIYLNGNGINFDNSGYSHTIAPSDFPPKIYVGSYLDSSMSVVTPSSSSNIAWGNNIYGKVWSGVFSLYFSLGTNTVGNADSVAIPSIANADMRYVSSIAVNSMASELYINVVGYSFTSGHLSTLSFRARTFGTGFTGTAKVLVTIYSFI